MTAQLHEKSAASTVRVRPARTRRPANLGPVAAPRPVREARQATWGRAVGHACEVERQAPVVAGPRVAVVSRPATGTGELVWTPRGLAVMVSLIAVTVFLMLVTVVGSFLSISSEPLQTTNPAVQAAVVAPAAHATR